MTNDEKLMQQALDAFLGMGQKAADVMNGDAFHECSIAVSRLRARLAQPQNEFNPDWDAMAVMVEEQQRMAKRIEELEARLAQPELQQRTGDCLLTGVCASEGHRIQKAQPEPEPVAVVCLNLSKVHVYHGAQYCGEKQETKIAVFLKDVPIGENSTPPHHSANGKP